LRCSGDSSATKKKAGSVDDALRTMAVVEAAYASSAHGATPVTLPA
jgi:hypothetical protein